MNVTPSLVGSMRLRLFSMYKRLVLLAVVVRKESKKVSKKGEKGRGKKQKKRAPLERSKAKKKKSSLFALLSPLFTLASLKSALDHENIEKIVPRREEREREREKSKSVEEIFVS